MSLLLSICHLGSYFSALIFLPMSRRQHLKKRRYQRYVFSALRNIILFHGSYPIQPPASFVGAGNSLGGQPTGSSSQGKGKGKAAADTGANKADAATWSTGPGRSLGSRPANGVGARTLGAGVLGVGGASIPRPPQRSGKKPARRERSPTPDYGVDDDDDVIVIDSDVD